MLRRIPSPAIGLLALLLAVPLAPVHAQEDVDDRVWIIDDLVECHDETWTESREIIVYGEGRLVLDGCRLLLESEPYEDQWIGANEEGIVIHVLLGGRLELRHSGDRPASLEPVDPRYGYTLDVNGVFVSEGTPSEPNRIVGLEGFMAESFIGGGIRIFSGGRAYVNHTDFADLQGPALMAQQGGRIYARDVDVQNARGGAFSATDGVLDVRGSDVVTGVEAIRVTDSDVRLENVTAMTDRAGLHASGSTVDARNLTVVANYNAVVLTDSSASFRDCDLAFGTLGVAIQQADTGARRPATFERCLVRARPSPVDTLGMLATHSRLTILDSEFRNATRGQVSAADSEVEIRGTTFSADADTDVFLTDPAGWTLEGNTASSSADRPVRILYSINVEVEADGDPAEGARVTLGEQTVNTTAEGKARLLWEPPVEGGEAGAGTARVEVEWDGRTKSQEADLEDRDLVFRFSQGSRLLPGPGPGAFALALAAVALLRRKA